MKCWILAAALLAGTAMADCVNKFDDPSGNNYRVCRNERTGEVNIEGYNTKDGSMWRQTMRRDGSYYGTDKGQHFYSGDQPSGYYQSMDPKHPITCIGNGSACICK